MFAWDTCTEGARLPSSSLENSSLGVGKKALLWEPIVAISYVVGLIGLLVLFTARQDPTRILSGLALCAVIPLWVKLWRWQLVKRWNVYVREFLDEGDMVDVGRFYAVEKPKNNDDGGPSAFWVVEATEGKEKRIVGCIGLGASNNLSRYLLDAYNLA